jgi:hypothetical protein
MKKYNMIEDRNDLTQKEVEEGMDFNKILENNKSIKSKFLKPAIILISLTALVTVCIFILININPEEIKVNTNSLPQTIEKNESSAIETYSLYFGSKLAVGEVLIKKDELTVLKSIDVKGSQAISNFKLVGFTLTTLTKNGISQINIEGNTFSSEMKELFKSIKSGQNLYFENIMIQDRTGAKSTVNPITVLIK